MEVELTALDTASVEAEWLRELLMDFTGGWKTCADYFHKLW